MKTFFVTEHDVDTTLAAVLRRHLELSWNDARRLCETGKVFVNENRELDSVRRMKAGASIEIRMNAKAPLSKEQTQALSAIVYEDSQVIVIDKPAGISSVPYDRGESGTAMDLIREAWRTKGLSATSTPLLIVHRIDKETSGLLMFAKTKAAEIFLQKLLRAHEVERKYLCVAHGRVVDQTIDTYFIDDRGDGLRGSVKEVSRHPHAKHAITHVRALEYLNDATLCEVKLETGKTHQIRIHLAEREYPLVGETVYIRDFIRHGHVPIESPRLLLHAETLGFVHPTTSEPMMFSREPPLDFRRMLKNLQKPRIV